MKKTLIFVMVLSLAVMTVNCGDYLSGGILDSSPNSADQVYLETMMVALQPITYGFYIGDIGVYAAVWMQQMAGVGHQYLEYERYEMNNYDHFGFFGQLYMEGGLIDIRTLKARAEEEGKQSILGMAKLYEAMMFSIGADTWGDIPYSEAATDVENPVYDSQASVYSALLALLDSAIGDLQAAENAGAYINPNTDFSFGGDRNKMIRAAHTLKARILLNNAEVNSGNYALALAEAQQGINSVSGNWTVPFDDIVNEQNIWYQFWVYRGRYVRAGHYLVEQLRSRNDPRLEFYFGLAQDGSGTIYGSKHAEMNEGASWLNPDTWGDPGWDLEMVSWEENQFIIAECQYNLGDEDEALITLNETLLGIQARWGLDAIPPYAGISGIDLLKAIMLEKYNTLFLNPQVWSDWRRTGFPQISANLGLQIPRRFMYPDDEENTNENFPGVKGIYGRNPNDPGDPSYIQ